MSTKKLAFATIVYTLGTILEPVLVGMPVVSAVANTTRYCTNFVLQYNSLLCKPQRQLLLLLTTLKNKMSVLCTFKAVLEVDGRVQAVRGILDSGSTLSFLTYRVANSLKARKPPM